MRIFVTAGITVASLLLAAPAWAACSVVLDPQTRDIDQSGSYCLDADRERPIAIQANDVELDCRGHTIAHRDDEPGINEGLHLRGGNNVTVRNCRLKGWNQAIVLERFNGAQLLNNTIVADGSGILVYGGDQPEGDGLRLVGNRIFYYEARTGGTAIGVNHSRAPVLTNNVVAGIGGSVYLNRAPDAQLKGNQFLDLNASGTAAVQMEQSPRAQLIHNTVMYRRGVNGRGLAGATDATCIENIFINAVHSGLESCVVRRYNVDVINND